MKNYTKAYTEGYHFDMNSYVKSAWAKLNSQMGTYVGYSLLFFLISVVSGVIPVLNVFSSLVQLLLGAGFFIYASKQHNNTAEFKDFFGGFSLILPIFLYGITYVVLLIPGFLLLFGFVFPIDDFISLVTSGGTDEALIEQLLMAMLGNITSASGILSLLVAIVYFIYIGVSYVLALPLIVVGKLNFWPAMEVSRKTIGKNFVLAFGMLFLLGIAVAAATIVTCGLGLLLAFPFMYLVYFEMYDQIFETEYTETETDSNEE